MALSQSRIELRGHSAYPWEQEAIEFALQQLPNSKHTRVWCLIDYVDASTGRLYEIDLVVLGYNALYLIEIKSGPGLYEGDSVDWWRTPEDGLRRYMDPPLISTNHKAKVIKSRLVSKLRDRGHAPWIEPLVFLSHEDAKLGFKPDGRIRVVTRDTFVKAITHHDFPGARAPDPRRRITRPQAEDITQALAKLGFRAREGKARVGPYELGDIIADGPGYQDRLAQHVDKERIRRRARIYLVPSQTSVERRQQLRRAADREAMLLHDVREHRGVLQFVDYVSDAPLGPTVLFDDFEGGTPLPAFLRDNPDLDVYERISIIEQVGRALDHCHKKGVVHGGLSPEAILIRRHPESGDLETRIANFQLGFGSDIEGTSHWTSLAAESWLVYQAPEFLSNTSNRTAQADIFALGAVAYFVLTGAPPASTLAEAYKLLDSRQCFDPSVVDDGILPAVSDLVGFATQVSFAARPDDAGDWVELLVAEATRPAPAPEPDAPPPPISPLDARPDDILDTTIGMLEVKKVLGHGATARVLLVEREDGRQLALKASLSPDHDPLLAAEAKALAGFRHARIVQYVDTLTIADRPCLLLALAGSQTLHRRLAQEGSLSLEFASRFGEDLLSALEYLEELNVTHRDIKPANLGVGSVARKAEHLTLFDFSLVDAPLSNLQVGTSAYRDPFLFRRGHWDSAADRWSAAVTLHEMLAGVRPTFGERDVALDQDAELRLAAERFDPTVREQLTAFFTKALDRDTEQRYDSARDMRRAWEACYEASAAPVAEATEADSAPAEDAGDGPGDDAIAAIAPDHPIAGLPLSVRAKNALDRAGLTHTRDLLALPDNQLSAIRGIGTRVAKEILAFRDRWRALRELAPTELQPFFPGYRGADLSVVVAIANADIAAALADAGLHTLAVVASAPASQIATLAERRDFDRETVSAVLHSEHRRAGEREQPSTLEGWAEALFGGKNTKPAKYVRCLLGLEQPFAGRIDVAPKEVAREFSINPVNIYVALGKRADKWRAHASIDDLAQLCRNLLEQRGGALPLGAAGTLLLERIPYDRSDDPALSAARAAALMRVVAEVEKDDPDGLEYGRLPGGAPWIALSTAHLAAARHLGEVADKLARRAVIASPGEAARALAAAVEGTPLEHLAPAALTELGASASKNAARSTPLEIYPVGMAASRALELSASVLTNDLTADAIRGRVHARYPEAAELPADHDALVTLLAPFGLQWNPDSKTFVRPGAHGVPTQHTQFSSLTSATTRLVTPTEAPDPDDVARHEFEDKVRSAIERRRFRVLGVSAKYARQAALALADRMGLSIVSYDKAFAAAMHGLCESEQIDPSVVYDIDAEGPSGAEWQGLQNLAATAAGQVADELAAIAEPTLLIHPGLVARYRLVDSLRRIVTTAKAADNGPLMILVPGHDRSGVPLINGALAIPALERSDALWIPQSWIGRSRKEAA